MTDQYSNSDTRLGRPLPKIKKDVDDILEEGLAALDKLKAAAEALNEANRHLSKALEQTIGDRSNKPNSRPHLRVVK